MSGTGKDTRIDAAAADAGWAANTRVPVRTLAADADPEGTQVRTGLKQVYAQELVRAGASSESRADAERRKEIALANTREHEYELKTGAVVDRATVVSGWFAVCRAARHQAQGIRERLVARLFLTPAQADVVKEELQMFLEALSKEVPVLGDPLPEPVVLP